jgi:hypothetical protein
LIVLVAVLCLSIFLRRPVDPIRTISELAECSRPVDLQAFRNLVDADEEAYLRSTLSPADFRRLQRSRMIAATEYVRRTAHNAALLLKVGDLARRAPNDEVSKAGAELANRALQLRLYSLLSMCIFGLRIALPSLPVRPSRIIGNYDRARECMAGLTRLQTPEAVSLVDAAL